MWDVLPSSGSQFYPNFPKAVTIAVVGVTTLLSITRITTMTTMLYSTSLKSNSSIIQELNTV